MWKYFVEKSAAWIYPQSSESWTLLLIAVKGNHAILASVVSPATMMRPDRIVVGEVRGEEAFDMLQAMNTGHEGSLTTVHANSRR
jgi:type IV secretory pathway ATPase VirB11/archaellum biosynthesis ATPase